MIEEQPTLEQTQWSSLVAAFKVQSSRFKVGTGVNTLNLER